MPLFTSIYFKLFQLFKAAIFAFASRRLAGHLVLIVKCKSCSIYQVRDKRDTKKAKNNRAQTSTRRLRPE